MPNHSLLTDLELAALEYGLAYAYRVKFECEIQEQEHNPDVVSRLRTQELNYLFWKEDQMVSKLLKLLGIETNDAWGDDND